MTVLERLNTVMIRNVLNLRKKYFIVCISSYSFIFLILRKIYTKHNTSAHTAQEHYDSREAADEEE